MTSGIQITTLEDNTAHTSESLAKIQAIEDSTHTFEEKTKRFHGTSGCSDFVILEDGLMENITKLDRMETKNIEEIRERKKVALKHAYKVLADLDKKTQKSTNGTWKNNKEKCKERLKKIDETLDSLVPRIDNESSREECVELAKKLNRCFHDTYLDVYEQFDLGPEPAQLRKRIKDMIYPTLELHLHKYHVHVDNH